MTPLTPELYCTDIKISLYFYINVLGFNIQYQRQEEGFAMLEREGARIMLEQINKTNRVWLAAPLEVPFGRGINLEIRTDNINELYRHVQNANASIFMSIEEKYYQVNDTELCNRQFIVSDPDGYLLRFSQTVSRQKKLTSNLK